MQLFEGVVLGRSHANRAGGGEQADLNDKASLSAAIKGAYAVFAVTDFWTSMKKEVEVEQGKNVADVSKVCLYSLNPLHYIDIVY